MKQLVEEFRTELDLALTGLNISPGYKRTDKCRHNISLALKGHEESEEKRIKHSLALKGRPGGFIGHNHGLCKKCGKYHPSTKGSKWSEESKTRRKEYLSTPEGKENIWKACNSSQALEVRAKANEHHKEFFTTPRGRELKIMLANIATGVVRTPETIQKLRESSLTLWQTKEYVENVLDGMNRKPSTLELQFTLFLQEYFPGVWEYVGDYSFWVPLSEPLPNGTRNLNPDYKRVNSRVNGKKLIELNGPYYHDNDNPQDRVDGYAKAGWECLVIWWYELQNKETLVEKIMSYI